MLVTAFLIPLPLQQPRTDFDDKEAYVYGWGHCMLSAIEDMLKSHLNVCTVCAYSYTGSCMVKFNFTLIGKCSL